MEEELKSCPFCGGSNLKLYTTKNDDDYNDYHGIIECTDCRTQFLGLSNYVKDEMAKFAITNIWNKRANAEEEPLENSEEVVKTEYNLQPCPFCGSHDVYIQTGIATGSGYIGIVGCENCNAEMFSSRGGDDEKEAREDAVAKWNNRSSETLNDLAQKIYNNAKNHGWWDTGRTFGDIIALCHSELSEALEEYRNSKPMIYYGQDSKPEGVAVEMIDCIIRILDWVGHENIDVDKILSIKHEYNKKRPYRHGNKTL